MKKYCKYILLLMIIVGLGSIYWKMTKVQAETINLITSKVDFDKGVYDQTESYTTTGEIKLQPAGEWGPQGFGNPKRTFNNGTALVSDDKYVYAMANHDLYFARYTVSDNKWKTLANPPFNSGGGADMVILGDYIYTIFGNISRQKYFARYKISTNTWEILPETLDKMSDGASLTTDGTFIYFLRGAWTTDFYKYNPVTRVWSVLANANYGIQQGANMVYKDGNIYTPRGYYTEMLRYNIFSDGWSTLAPMPVNPYYSHNIELIGDKMYVTQEGGRGFYEYKLPDLGIVGGIGITTAGLGYTAGSLIVDNTGTGGSGLAATFTTASNGSINGVTVTSIGSGYQSMPRVYPPQVVISVGITNGGTGYTGGAFIVDNTGTGGSGFAANYSVNSSGTIIGVTVVNTGYGYSNPPVLTPIQNIRSIGITNGGVGYTAGAFIVDNTGTGGSGFAANYSVNGSGTIIGITLVNTGAGYSNPPVLMPIQNIASVGITSGGTGYTAGALIVDNTGTGGSGFAGTYTVSGGVINGITITNRGAGYSIPPIISPQPGGTGANLKAYKASGAVLAAYKASGAILAPNRSRNAVLGAYQNDRGAWTQLRNLPESNGYVGVVHSKVDNLMYVFRGNGNYEFWKYNIGANTFMGPADLPFSSGNGADMVYWNNYIYTPRGANTATFWRYNIVGNSYEQLADMPSGMTLNDAVRGVGVSGYIYFLQGSSVQNFARYNTNTNTWELLAAPLASQGNGASLMYPGSGDFIYAMRGHGSRTFWRYSISLNSWLQIENSPDNCEGINGSAMASDGSNIYLMGGYGQSALAKYNIGTTTWTTIDTNIPFGPYTGSDMAYYDGKLYFQAGYFRKDVWEYTIASNTWRRLQDLQGFDYRDMGPNNGGALEVDGNGNLYSSAGQGIRRVQKYTPVSNNYVASGNWMSEEMSLPYVSAWGKFLAEYTLPDDSSISFQIRGSVDRLIWTDWTAISHNDTIGLGTTNRYVQVKALMTASTGNTSTPILKSVSISYTGDTNPPSNPATFTGISQQVSGIGLTNGGTYRYMNPYFSWNAGTDNNESGVEGYYVYFGVGETADPVVSGNYQTATNYLVAQNLDNGTKYYLRIKTKDQAGNVSEAVTGFEYIYSGVDPTAYVVNTGVGFSAGTFTNMAVANDKLRLSQINGFWLQERMQAAIAGTYYGSGLAYVEASQKMYLIRGSDTNQFYEYDLNLNRWLSKSTTPATAYYGSAMVAGPTDFLYAFRGRATNKFWRYQISTDTWSDDAAMDFPGGTVSYGGALQYDGSRYIYALRGNSSDMFYRYDTSLDLWERMENTDFGVPDYQANNLVYDGGSLTYDGDDSIYALKGGTTDGWSVYSIGSNMWTVLPMLPHVAQYGARIVYEPTQGEIYYMPGYAKPFFYKYDIDSQSWTELPQSPYPIGGGSSLILVNGDLIHMRGDGDSRMEKFNLKAQEWETPVRGIFGNYYRGIEALGQDYGANIVRGAGQDYYITRGGFNSEFTKYNTDTGTSTPLQSMPFGMYNNGKLLYLGDRDLIIGTPSSYSRKWFNYTISTDTWVENTGDTLPFDPGEGHSMVYDGSRYIYASRGAGTRDFWRYDFDAAVGSRWSRSSNVFGTLGHGSQLVKNGNYLYVLQGQAVTPNLFYRMDLGTTLWTTLPSTSERIYNGGWLADGNDGYLYAMRGENLTTMFRYSLIGNTWESIGSSMSPLMNSGANAAGNGTDRIYAVTGSAGGGNWNAGIYTYILRTENTAFKQTGSYISEVHDLTKVYRFSNISVGYTGAQNSWFTISTKTSTDSVVWSDWELATTTREIGTTKLFQVNSPRGRYIQVKIEMVSSDNVYSGSISDYSINYFQDAVAPTNPSVLDAYTAVGSTETITSNAWYNYATPRFDWRDAEVTGGSSDGASGSGVKGYYVYFGVGATADPAQLGTLVTVSEYTAPAMVSGNTYYLRIKAVDEADNINETTWEPFVYKYDNVKPINPTTIISDPPGYTTSNSYTFDWNDASDEESGVKDYCYKTGQVGATEVCTTETVVADISSYQSGTNTFYVRARDNAGNYANDYITSTFYYSSNAPSPPLNLSATPIPEGSTLATNTTNEFAFSWAPPSFFFGAQTGLKYYYSINALPTAANVTAIDKTYLTSGAYATQAGINSFYVVAKDEAGNIDYNLYSKIDFISDSPVPGIPQLLEIADVSDKESKIWKLSVNWEAPEASGSGGIGYRIYRSTVTGASCANDMSVFTKIEDFQSGNSIVDGSDRNRRLIQQKYYYCVETCDSTNQCSAPSSTVSLLPDGKWRVAPTLVASPSAVVKTKSAIISWSTNRSANSFVKYGKSSGNYGEEVGSSDQVTSHEINLTGLDPGTNYYYVATWTDEDGNSGSTEEQMITTNPAPIVSKVQIVDIGMYSAYVKFTMANATTASVQYGKGRTAVYTGLQSITTSKEETTYTIKIDNLTEGSPYHLRILAEDEESNQFFSDDYVFETLPVPRISDAKIQQVKGMSTSTIRVTWKTNTPVSSIITYYPVGRSEMSKDQIVLTLVKNHEMIIKDLLDDTDYVVIVKGKDIAGNNAEGSSNNFKTSQDLRPPTITDLKIDTSVTGVGEEAKVQMMVSWNTDEMATTQVEYGQGTGNDYPNKTQEDDKLTMNHTVTIPDLLADQVYHLRVVSRDKNGNITNSYDNVVITPKATQSALNLVINSLSKSFGFISNFSGALK